MNIEMLCNLVKESGQSRAIITIDTDNDQAVVVVNIPTAHNNSVDASKESSMQLRKALSTPLCVMGKIADVDSSIDDQLATFGEGFAPASNELNTITKFASNATTVKSKMLSSVNVKESKKAPVKAKTTDTMSKPKVTPKPKSTSKSKKTDTPSETVSSYVENEKLISEDNDFDMFFNEDSAL